MKAAVIYSYGAPAVLQVSEIARPSIKPDQVLVKVFASSINPIEWKMRQGMLKLLTGNRFPITLGFDVSGEVIEIGQQVTRFKPGDLIYACMDQLTGGAYAEYAAVAETAAALKPKNMRHEEAAAIPLAGMTALQALRDEGGFKAGQNVLINGASGGVGTYAVQLAKVLGASTIVGVCSSKNASLVKRLGADLVIDYTKQDFTKDSVKYDVVFDVVGDRSLLECRSVLQPKGIYVTTQPYPGNYLKSAFSVLWPGQRYKVVLLKSKASDLDYLKAQIEAGNVRSVIDKTYSLEQIAKAHTFAEKQRTVGKSVVAISERAYLFS